jgi:hypothetical protein
MAGDKFNGVKGNSDKKGVGMSNQELTREKRRQRALRRTGFPYLKQGLIKVWLVTDSPSRKSQSATPARSIRIRSVTVLFAEVLLDVGADR